MLYPLYKLGCTNVAGKCWMDALDLAMRCSGLLNRSMSRLESLSSEVTVELKAEHHDRQPVCIPMSRCMCEEHLCVVIPCVCES